jgi:hypothetical protein
MLALTSSCCFNLLDCASDGRSWRLCTRPFASFGLVTLASLGLSVLDVKIGRGVVGCGVPNKTCLKALTANTGAGVIDSKVDTSRSNQTSALRLNRVLPSASLDSGFRAPDIQDNISRESCQQRQTD